MAGMSSASLSSRREFLGAAVAPAILHGGLRRVEQPNILVIMSDEHNHRLAGYAGNPLARTPNLDRLAASGVTFENCYTNSPLCVPSRLVFTSGKYIHRTGAWSNSCELPRPDYPSLPAILNRAGYQSYLCGKQHYAASRRYGFTEIGDMNRSRKDGRNTRRAADDTSRNLAGARQRIAGIAVAESSTVMAHDRHVTAGVVDFLARRKPSERPFFLFAGYLAPHFPLTVPRNYLDHFRGKVGMPNLPPGLVERLPLNYQHLRRGFGLDEFDNSTTLRGREHYYALAEWVDSQVGEVLNTLARSSVARDTIVIYTTDHGENMGEHGLWWKNCLFEHGAHIPLVASWPERWKGGTRRGGVCSMVDLVQTIAELGRAAAPQDWNGHSLLPVLDDAKARWKDMAVSQYYAHNIASGFAMIRQGRWKYIYHSAPDAAHPAVRELYDLAADPDELRDRAGEPQQGRRIAEMHAALVKELGEHPDQTESRCRAETSRGYPQPL